MSRRRVDLPHPEGPISETNAPLGISRSIRCNAGVLSSPAPKTLSTPRTRTTESVMCLMTRRAPAGRQPRPPAPARRSRSHDRSHDDRGPQLRRTGHVELVEVEDRATQAIADTRGKLA